MLHILVVAGANKVAGTCRSKQDPDFTDTSNINFIILTDYLIGIELAIQLQYWSDTVALIEFVIEQGMMIKEDMHAFSLLDIFLSSIDEYYQLGIEANHKLDRHIACFLSCLESHTMD